MFNTVEALHDNITNKGFYPLTHEQAVIGNDEVDLETKLKKINKDISKSVIDYSKEYLTTEALENGTISFIISSGINTNLLKSISYSIDNGTTWTTINNEDNKEDNIQINVNASKGDKVLWKGNALALSDENDNVSSFVSDIQINVYGNIMSLLYGDNFINQTSLPDVGNNFSELFANDINAGANVVNASNLILPATTLVNGCYSNMFRGCKSLTTAPELPATTLAYYCYNGMFDSCIALTTAPEILPATTLANGCYGDMFYGCTSLTTAPKLPATTLAYNCCHSMFEYCTSLTTTPELPATTLADGCYVNMFNGCTSLTTAPVLPATTLAESCYTYMFVGCTSLTIAPELPATTLADWCYNSMFQGCTSLNYIKCLARNIPATNCVTNWVENVSSTGTFVKADSMSSWTIGNIGIPAGWNIYTESEYKEVKKYELNAAISNIVASGLPQVSASDNGKILMVVNGQWQLVSPST